MKRATTITNRIEGLDPDMPATKAARRALKVRLEAIPELLSLAVNRDHSETEHVHRLRVTTRRAGAVLTVFNGLMSPSRLRRMRMVLRRIRRAAAAARQDDVHKAILSQHLQTASAELSPVLQSVIDEIERSRVGSHRAISRVARRYPAGKFVRRRKRLMNSIELRGAPVPPSADNGNGALHHSGTNGQNGKSATIGSSCDTAAAVDPTLLQFARRRMPEFVVELRDAVGANGHTVESLHAMRLIGKRLRYVMEIFADCFEPAFETDHYRTVETLQQHLGKINDDVEIAARLREFIQAHCLPRTRKALRVNGVLFDDGRQSGLESLIRYYEAELERRRNDFLAWQRDVRLEVQLDQLLALIAAGRPSATAETVVEHRSAQASDLSPRRGDAVVGRLPDPSESTP